MPTTDPVAAFITRNNAILQEIEDLLTEATNPSHTDAEQSRALGTAGHLACRSLKRLHDADEELWTPIEEQRPRLYQDQDRVLRLSDARGPYEAPKAPVKEELFELFRHPNVDEVADLISRANRVLEQVVRDLSDELGAVILRAKGLVNELRVETCQLEAHKAPRQRRISTIRTAAGVIAMSNLLAAANELQKRAWDVSPEILRHIAELLQHMGHSLGTLPVLGLLAMTTMQQDAEHALKQQWPAWAISDRDDTPKRESRNPRTRVLAGEQRSGQPNVETQSMNDPPSPASDQYRDSRYRGPRNMPPTG